MRSANSSKQRSQSWTWGLIGRTNDIIASISKKKEKEKEDSKMKEEVYK